MYISMIKDFLQFFGNIWRFFKLECAQPKVHSNTKQLWKAIKFDKKIINKGCCFLMKAIFQKRRKSNQDKTLGSNHVCKWISERKCFGTKWKTEISNWILVFYLVPKHFQSVMIRPLYFAINNMEKNLPNNVFQIQIWCQIE